MTGLFFWSAPEEEWVVSLMHCISFYIINWNCDVISIFQPPRRVEQCWFCLQTDLDVKAWHLEKHICYTFIACWMRNLVSSWRVLHVLNRNIVKLMWAISSAWANGDDVLYAMLLRVNMRMCRSPLLVLIMPSCNINERKVS